MFKELFTEFNARYDTMNGGLSNIKSKEHDLSIQDRQFIIDYFNLCAEEFLFFRERCIPEEVWTAWCRGMLYYITREPFHSVWNEESAKGSYYNLTIESINIGSMKYSPRSK